MFLVFVKFTEEHLGVVGVAHPWFLEIRRNMPEQASRTRRRFHASAITDAGRVLAVAAICKPLPFAKIPEMATRGNPSVGPSHLAMSAVGDRPSLLVVIGGVRGVGPGMAILAHLAVTKEVVQQNKSFGQGVVVGRYFTPENSEPRIAVAARFVAQHLIVGPILLDDVENMVDR